MRSKRPDETSRGLLELLARFSAPAEVVTDRGGEFQGAFQQLLQQCFVDHRLTSTGHPQADGGAERLVQVVKAALRKHCKEAERSDDWDLQLRREAPAGPEQALPEADPVLFPNAATRRRDQEAAVFDGKRVKRSVITGKGRQRRQVPYLDIIVH